MKKIKPPQIDTAGIAPVEPTPLASPRQLAARQSTKLPTGNRPDQSIMAKLKAKMKPKAITQTATQTGDGMMAAITKKPGSPIKATTVKSAVKQPRQTKY